MEVGGSTQRLLSCLVRKATDGLPGMSEPVQSGVRLMALTTIGVARDMVYRGVVLAQSAVSSGLVPPS